MGRKTTPCKCAVCGKAFTAKRGDAMYCSKRCKNAAYYARHRRELMARYRPPKQEFAQFWRALRYAEIAVDALGEQGRAHLAALLEGAMV